MNPKQMINHKRNELTLSAFIAQSQQRLIEFITPYLHKIPAPPLREAIHYTLANGGKRLRPLLIYATGSLFNTPWEILDIPACAVELIHTYSLIHDDLPCMDNADLRRGQATCHKVFPEGIAVLAGDALNSLAFDIIANHPCVAFSAEKRLQMIAELSRACGPFGMAAGQALDITQNESINEASLTQIHQLKTGKLFSACVELGRLCSNQVPIGSQARLQNFAETIGLAFQIQDDILDIEATTASLGKAQGSDMHKLTYPKIIGLAQAKAKVNQLYETAHLELREFGDQAQLLIALTDLMLKRKK